MKKDKYEILYQSGSTYNIPINLFSTLDELGVMVTFDGDVEQVEQLCNFTYTTNGNVLTVYNTTNTNILKRVIDATFTINWGDSTTSSIGILGSVSHTYSNSGIKIVKITMNSPWGVQSVVKEITLPSVIGSTTDMGTLVFNIPYTDIEDFTQDFNNDYDYNTTIYTGTTTFFAIGTSRIIEKKQYGVNTYNDVTYGSITIENDIYTYSGYTIDGLTYLDLNDGTTYITGNTANYVNEVEFNKKLTRNEHYLGFINEPIVYSDVFVERGKMGASEYNLRLGEIDNVGELSVYGNGFFRVKK